MIRFAVFKAAATVLIGALLATACGEKQPVLKPQAPEGVGSQRPPTVSGGTGVATPPPPTAAPDPRPVPPEPIREELLSSASLDDLNRNSPLKPVFFELDSADIGRDGQVVLDENGAQLKRSSSWIVTIEGHTDERGTAEYNLALGERRAVAARAYLISIGIAAERLRTVSYGKEFPFDPGHDEASMAKNRRAHFVITAK